MMRAKNIFMEAKQTRKAKLQAKRGSGNKTVPELRIKGNWLERAGFKAGATVQIPAGGNELIIKPL